jgi:hypothetical protein
LSPPTRAPFQRRFAERAVGVAKALVGVAIVLEPAALFADGADTETQRVAQRAGDIGFALEGIVLAVFEIDTGRKLGGRLARDEIDGAAGGIAPVKRPGPRSTSTRSMSNNALCVMAGTG